MKKRNHKRRPFDRLAGIALLGRMAAAQSRDPLTRSQQVEVSLRVHAALKALMEGRAEEIDVHDLVNASNITMVLAEYGLGEKDVATAGQDACARIDARHARTGRYAATGEDARALQDLLDLYDAQVASPDCVEGMLMAACNEVKRRQIAGNVVQAVPA